MVSTRARFWCILDSAAFSPALSTSLLGDDTIWSAVAVTLTQISTKSARRGTHAPAYTIMTAMSISSARLRATASISSATVS